MIRSIELRNWKAHTNSRLEFQKGVNVLVGLMGAGKSSIMDAISFALFGSFPALEHRRVKISDIPTSRPVALTDAEVKLVFDSGADEYTVTRTIQKGKTSGARLEKNGEYLQTQPERVTEEVCNVLKIGYDTFSRAVYSEQNNLEYFLELDKKNRKRQIDEMLGLDHFATVEDNSTSLINSMKSLVKEDEQMLGSMNAPAIKEKVAELEKELDKTSKEGAEAMGEEGSLKEQLAKMKEELEIFKRENARKVELKSKMEGMRSRSATLKAEIEKLKGMRIDEEALRRERTEALEKDRMAEKEVEKARAEWSSAQKAVSATDSVIAELGKKAKVRDGLLEKTKGKDLKALAASLEKEREQLQKLSGEIAASRSRRDEVNEWLKELSKHVGGKCPVCERELEPELRKRLLASKEALLHDLSSGIESNSKVVKEKEKLVAELDLQVKELQVALDKLNDYIGIDEELEKARSSLAREKEELKAKESALEKRNKEAEAQKNALRDLQSREEALARMKGYEKEKAQTDSELEKAAKELDGIRVDDRQLDALQGRFTEQSAKLSAAREKRSSMELHAKGIRSQLDERKKELDTLAGIERRITLRRERVKNLSKFKDAIIAAETMLRSRLVTSINELMQGLWPSLYPYGDYAGIMLKADNDDYELVANVGADGASEWVPVNSVASGGERSVACLALRIAMAMVIVPNLRWLILDEPTHNIDSAGIGKLIDVFGNSLPDIVEQIFIITHDESLKQINNARVFVLDRDKSVNGPTIIGSA